jgi:hypothetical protein
MINNIQIETLIPGIFWRLQKSYFLLKGYSITDFNFEKLKKHNISRYQYNSWVNPQKSSTNLYQINSPNFVEILSSIKMTLHHQSKGELNNRYPSLVILRTPIEKQKKRIITYIYISDWVLFQSLFQLGDGIKSKLISRYIAQRTNIPETSLMGWIKKGHKPLILPDEKYPISSEAFKMAWKAEFDFRKTKYEEIKAIVENQHRGELLSDEYIASTEKMKVKCKNGHRWFMEPRNIISGHWCTKDPIEESKKRITGSKIRASQKKHYLQKIIDYARENQLKLLSAQYESKSTDLEFQCSQNHKFFMSSEKLQKKKRKNIPLCPVCEEENQLDEYKKEFNPLFTQYAQNFKGFFLEIKSLHPSSINFRCPLHGSFSLNKKEINKTHWCKECMESWKSQDLIEIIPEKLWWNNKKILLTGDMYNVIRSLKHSEAPFWGISYSKHFALTKTKDLLDSWVILPSSKVISELPELTSLIMYGNKYCIKKSEWEQFITYAKSIENTNLHLFIGKQLGKKYGIHPLIFYRWLKFTRVPMITPDYPYETLWNSLFENPNNENDRIVDVDNNAFTTENYVRLLAVVHLGGNFVLPEGSYRGYFEINEIFGNLLQRENLMPRINSQSTTFTNGTLRLNLVDPFFLAHLDRKGFLYTKKLTTQNRAHVILPQEIIQNWKEKYQKIFLAQCLSQLYSIKKNSLKRTQSLDFSLSMRNNLLVYIPIFTLLKHFALFPSKFIILICESSNDEKLVKQLQKLIISMFSDEIPVIQEYPAKNSLGGVQFHFGNRGISEFSSTDCWQQADIVGRVIQEFLPLALNPHGLISQITEFCGYMNEEYHLNIRIPKGIEFAENLEHLNPKELIVKSDYVRTSIKEIDSHQTQNQNQKLVDICKFYLLNISDFVQEHSLEWHIPKQLMEYSLEPIETAIRRGDKRGFHNLITPMIQKWNQFLPQMDSDHIITQNIRLSLDQIQRIADKIQVSA